jgi:hypothetical protein
MCDEYVNVNNKCYRIELFFAECDENSKKEI